MQPTIWDSVSTKQYLMGCGLPGYIGYIARFLDQSYTPLLGTNFFSYNTDILAYVKPLMSSSQEQRAATGFHRKKEKVKRSNPIKIVRFLFLQINPPSHIVVVLWISLPNFQDTYRIQVPLWEVPGRKLGRRRSQ